MQKVRKKKGRFPLREVHCTDADLGCDRRRRVPRLAPLRLPRSPRGTTSSASTTSRPGSLENIDHLRGDHFTFLYHDVVEPIHIDGDVDFVFHLAALASPVDYLRAPLASLKVGSYGTHNALGLAKWKRARFLISSTSEVYGDPLVHPAARDLLGQRQSDRAARRVRRGEALRRGADDDVPHAAGRRHVHRADLQHVRAAHAPQRRARVGQLPQPGDSRASR